MYCIFDVHYCAWQNKNVLHVVLMEQSHPLERKQ